MPYQKQNDHAAIMPQPPISRVTSSGRAESSFCGAQAVFPIHQGFVKLEQRRRLDERAQLRNPARDQEQSGQSVRYAIEVGEIRSAMAGAIADEQLMPQ